MKVLQKDIYSKSDTWKSIARKCYILQWKMYFSRAISCEVLDFYGVTGKELGGIVEQLAAADGRC